MSKRRLLKVADVARQLGSSTWSVYDYIHHHNLPAVRIGRALRIDQAALDAWILERSRTSRRPARESGRTVPS